MKFTSCCEISQRTSFVSMMTLTSTFFFVELVVGYLTNSMALVADSFHMLSDVVSLFVGYIALRYSKRSSEGGNGRYTFGWARAEVLGALVNAVFLIALCFSILVESFKRIVVPEAIEDPKLVLLVGGIGLFVNIIGLMLFHNHGHSHGGGGHGHSHGGSGDHGHSHEGKNSKKNGLTHEETGKTEKSQLMIEGGLEVSIVDNKQQNVEENQLADENIAGASQLNMRGVYLHVLGDALGSVIVMVSALVILYVDAEWTLYVDPGMSIIMVMIILKTSFPLLKESSMILMQTVPTHIKLQEIQQRIQEQVPQVLGIHEFHVWQLAGNRIVASAHVRCNTPADYMQVANQLKELFHDEGIHSTTIQPEFLKEMPIEDEECVLECKEECNDRLCCSKPTDSIDKPNDSIDGNDCVETSSTKDEKSLKPKKEVRINIEEDKQ